MYIENQVLKNKWHSTNKKWFIEKGYEFTKIGDEFEVKYEDLMPKSRVKIKYICDYCGKECETTYALYAQGKQRGNGKDVCTICRQIKAADALEEKYGSRSLGGSSILRERAKKVMKEIYGAEYALQSKSGREHFENTMFEKYGVTNPVYSEDLRIKTVNSYFQNQTFTTSKKEIQMVGILEELYGKENCIQGYPVDKLNLDCLVLINDNKIDVEYDGKFWHKDKKDRDRKRNHFLISKGYKVLRILGNDRDILPTKEQIKEGIDYLLGGHHLAFIDMND